MRESEQHEGKSVVQHYSLPYITGFDIALDLFTLTIMHHFKNDLHDWKFRNWQTLK